MAFPINTEEAMAGQLPLPSPLDRPRGGRVGSAVEWNNVRRPEILDDFTRLMYGALPPRLPTMAKPISSMCSGICRSTRRSRSRRLPG